MAKTTWMELVNRIFKEKKARDSSYKYKDAMNTKDNLLNKPWNPILISRKRYG
jgi:hypothetical protein